MSNERHNLRELVVGGGPLGYPHAIKILLDVARQLADYGAGKPPFLDIRPGNIVFTESGSARLLVSTEPVAEVGPAHSALPINRLTSYFEEKFAVELLS